MIKKLLSVFMGFFSGLFAVIRGNLPKQDDCGVHCDTMNYGGDQFIPEKAFSVDDIARAFNVPVRLLESDHDGCFSSYEKLANKHFSKIKIDVQPAIDALNITDIKAKYKGWQPHDGGSMPVEPLTEVVVLYRSGRIYYGYSALRLLWEYNHDKPKYSDILAWRLA